jgi:rhamnosyltransferase
MEKCACVIVTYLPNKSVLQHIERVLELCGEVIVVDNTPKREKMPLPPAPHLTVCSFGENRGLAEALNKGIETAGEKGFENIFLLDQDSYVPEHFFEDMITFKSRMETRIAGDALYAPDFWDRNSESRARFPVLYRFTLRHVSCGEMASFRSEGAIIAITSGTLITYSAYKKIGPLKEDYFIDFLDNEYCLRAHKMGVKVLINCDVVLNHSIGTRSKHTFGCLTIKPNHHAPVRRYYIFRNGIRTALDYFRYYPSYSFLLVARLCHEMLSILLYENDRPRKFRALLYGSYHGIAGKMGKCELFETHERL